MMTHRRTATGQVRAGAARPSAGPGGGSAAGPRIGAALLTEYLQEVHRATAAYVAGSTPDDLDRVVDERWDPPVTLGVRLVSVIGDDLQHAGQAAFLRGCLERRRPGTRG